MKERPILFSAPMVRAILDGSKTQTRRALRDQTPFDLRAFVHGGHLSRRPVHDHGKLVGYRMAPVTCPYGVPDDHLWVREAWRVGKPHDHRSPTEVASCVSGERTQKHPEGTGVTVLYEAGGWKSVGPAGRDEPVYPDDEPMPSWAGKGRPSIHMPRVFSRITLEVTDVRVERLQDISAADARAVNTDTAGYVKVKLREPNVWGYLAQLVWASTHEWPLPKGHVLRYRDGDRGNCHPDNLFVATQRDLMANNTIQNYPEPIKQLVRARAGLVRKINDHEQNRRRTKRAVRADEAPRGGERSGDRDRTIEGDG